MAGRLDGKIAIITGGTSGIGAASAEVFAAEGAKVIIAGRSEEKGNNIAKQIGDNVIYHRADVTREADIKALVDLAMASVSMEMYKTENGKYPATMSELEGAGFSPERVNYDYVITEVHEDDYVITAVGQGDMVGDIWEVSASGTTRNVDNACD